MGITVEEFRRIAEEQNKGSSKKGKNKYNAKKTGKYASGKEADRAKVLQLLLRVGKISNLREQVRYLLIPPIKDETGKVIEYPCSYVADFVYNDADGNLVVEDTKGFRTKEYIIKRKLMLHVHGIRIKEI